jgi:peptidoglycan/xylan/chitin deacetylase (PgdA/CDA1 family)
LSIFACSGWIAGHSANSEDDVVARAASAIQWYDGEIVNISYGRARMMRLSPDFTAENIDALITDGDILLSELQELCAIIGKPRNYTPLCTWNDLKDLCALGVEIGAHSVTHVSLAQASVVRRRFEIAESKRLCELIAGRCDVFAYPYGTADVHNAATAADLRSAGYSAAFLSHSAFVRSTDDPMALPRITIPDEPMSDMEFRSRAQGAGIALQYLKTAVRV